MIDYIKAKFVRVNKRTMILYAAEFGQELDMSTGQRRIDIEEVGGVTIAKFVDKKILDEANIQTIGNHLFALIDEDGRRKIILDFSLVEYLSSAALGKLFTMDKKAKGPDAKLGMVCLRT